MILLQLIEDIKSRDSISDISRLVSDRLEAALHPTRVLIFYRHERRSDVTLGHSSAGDAGVPLSADGPVLRVLEQDPTAREYPFSDGATPSTDEVAYLERLGVRLMAPITASENRLIGILMLGERRSEQP